MKRLIVAIMALACLTATAQVFQSASFLNVRSLTIATGNSYTNTAPFYGFAQTTNASGLIYTNRSGTQITTALGATTGLVVITNGQAVYTNDTTSLMQDVPLVADRNGGYNTNWNLGVAMSFNATTTGTVQLVWAPIIKNPNNVGGQCIVDKSNTVTSQVSVLNNGFISTTIIPSGGLVRPAIAGVRLMEVTLTNSSGGAIIWDISRNTFVP